MLKKIDHLGIAVKNLDEAVAVWQQVLGLHLEKIEEVPNQKVRVAMFEIGESHIELLETTDPDGPIGRHVAKRGEGIHHVAFRVADVDAAMAELKERGLNFVADAPRPGVGGTRVVFAHPKSTTGVLVELVEPPR